VASGQETVICTGTGLIRMKNIPLVLVPPVYINHRQILAFLKYKQLRGGSYLRWAWEAQNASKTSYFRKIKNLRDFAIFSGQNPFF
jgi:hypothetical protein